MRNETGTINMELGDQKFDTQYEKRIYETAEDVLKELQGDDKSIQGVLRRINLAEDWDRRTSARAEFLKDGEAAKYNSIEKQVKEFVKAREKAKKPVSEAEARKRILAMLEE